MQSSKDKAKENLIRIVSNMGYPKEFGEVLSDTLGTEKQINRMISYLLSFKPQTAEEIADELVSIKEEFEKYKDKKIAEHSNSKYNEYLNSEKEN